MHAIRQHEFGPAETLRWQQVPDPHAEAGQVRIAVRAAGVHLIDTVLRAGIDPGGPLPRPTLPTVPGREVAGEVDEVGPGVDRDWLGARVVAHLGPASGGYAERAVRAVEHVHVVPPGLGFPAAVAMIGTGRTTMGILEVAAPAADDVVLVTAAAGGIGSLLVQCALRAGATVIALVGGPAKVARLRSTGAIAVDYDRQDWTADVRAAATSRPITLGYDGVGGALGRGVLESLDPGGRLVMFGWASGRGSATRLDTGDLVSRGLTVSWVVGPAMLRRRSLRSLETQALAEAATGGLVPAVTTFPLAEAAAAHRALETRQTVGKVVLVG